MKKKEIMDIVFLLDRSGSMSGMESDTIGGYNGYLEKMKDSNSRVTTVLFDDKYEMVTKKESISNVKKLDREVYFTRGSTALLDAIGKTISFIDKDDPKKVLFIITTDGLENASKEYNRDQIKELIQGHDNYEFIYLGADIDSYAEASSIGIRKERTSNYKKSSHGTGMMFDRLSKLSKKFECEECINSDWNDGLE